MYHFLCHSAHQFKRPSPALCRLRVCRHHKPAEGGVARFGNFHHLSIPFVDENARTLGKIGKSAPSPLNFRPTRLATKHVGDAIPPLCLGHEGRVLDPDITSISVNRTGTAIWTQRPHKKASCSRSSSLATTIGADRSSENRSRMPAMAAKGKRCASILINLKDIVLLTLSLETLPPWSQQPLRPRASLRRSPRCRGAAGQHLAAVRLPRSPARVSQSQSCPAGPCRPLSGRPQPRERLCRGNHDRDLQGHPRGDSRRC